MVMMGLKLMGDVPFSDVYIHGTILDEQGRKMSKSLGNGIDPIDVIGKYGADAMRFSLVVLSTEGQDLKLSESKFEMGRNFCNKLWNASRFAMMNLEDYDGSAPDLKELSLADKWIINRLGETANTIASELENFRFSVAAQELYRFVWNDFCDWYVEAAKLSLNDKENAASRKAAQHTLKRVLSEILHLAHPFLPFITEEIWSALAPNDGPLINSSYPAKREVAYEEKARLFDMAVREPVEAIRNMRGESNIPPAKRMPRTFSVFKDGELVERAAENKRYVEFLARTDCHGSFIAGSEPEETKKSATAVTANQTVFIPIEGLIDVAAEKARLMKEIARAENEIGGIEKKLANKSFVDGAPADIVERERERMAAAKERMAKLSDALAKVSSLA